MWVGGGGAGINSSKAYKIQILSCFIKWGIDLIFYGACFVLYKTLEAFDICSNCSVLQWNSIFASSEYTIGLTEYRCLGGLVNLAKERLLVRLPAV